MPLYRWDGSVHMYDFFEGEFADEEAVWAEAEKRAQHDYPGFSEIQGDVTELIKWPPMEQLIAEADAAEEAGNDS